jgi:hypothetical protein
VRDLSLLELRLWLQVLSVAFKCVNGLHALGIIRGCWCRPLDGPELLDL